MKKLRKLIVTLTVANNYTKKELIKKIIHTPEYEINNFRKISKEIDYLKSLNKILLSPEKKEITIIPLYVKKIARVNYSKKLRIKSAKEWNKDNGSRWTIRRISAKKFQAIRRIYDTCEIKGPIFNNLDDVNFYITKLIEMQIDSYWDNKMMFDYDVC